MQPWLPLLLVLLLLIVGGVVDARSCDPTAVSFELCYASPLCRARLFIDDNGNDTQTFEHLYTRVLASYLLEERVLSWLCAHHTIPDDVSELWVLLMSQHRFCEDNEFFDSELHECVCRADKLCKYMRPRDIEFHFTDHQIFLWAILFLIVVIVVIFLKKLRRLFKLLKKIANSLATQPRRTSK